MTTLFALKLKSQRVLFPLLLIVVAFQLVLGQTSSTVLADRQPPLSIAVQQQADDAYSTELVEDLGAVDNFEVIEVDTALSSDEVFRNNHVQGLLVVPADFGQGIEQGDRTPVMLYPAPGISNPDFAKEQIATTIMQLRARHDLTLALQELGEQDALKGDLTPTDLLDVVYQGPALQNKPLETPPVYGISALLILLAFLHTALIIPTHEDKRLRIQGRQAYRRQFLASLLVVWLVWLVVILLYFGFLWIVLNAPPDPLIIFGFVAIMLFSSLLAALLAQLFGRYATSWVFLPWFILNMTIGGGIWGQVALSPLLSPLVPVASVATPASASFAGVVLLFVGAALALAVSFWVPQAHLSLRAKRGA
jgi:hypothetical protein